MFSQVCVCSQGWICLVPYPFQGWVSLFPSPFPVGRVSGGGYAGVRTHSPQDGYIQGVVNHPPPDRYMRYYGMRSTSGQYASYWSDFLFDTCNYDRYSTLLWRSYDNVDLNIQLNCQINCKVPHSAVYSYRLYIGLFLSNQSIIDCFDKEE